MEIIKKFSQMTNNYKTKLIIEKEIPAIVEYFKDMDIEDFIKEQAYKNIKQIKYEPLSQARCGTYIGSDKTIIINSNTDDQIKHLSLVHEMLHAITYRNNYSRGFLRVLDKSIHPYGEKGRGLDEVITETCAEKITGITNNKSCMNEKPVYSIFKNIIGEEYFINDYIYGTDTVNNKIIDFYGKEMLKLYEKANVYLDTANIVLFKIGELDNNSDNYKQDAKIYNSILLKSYKLLSEIMPEIGELCIKTHKNNWYKEHSWELTTEQKEEFNNNAIKVIEEYKKNEASCKSTVIIDKEK